MRRADNATTFMCRLSGNLGASTSWNPQGLSRPVMGLLYLYLYLYTVKNELHESHGSQDVVFYTLLEFRQYLVNYRFLNFQ